MYDEPSLPAPSTPSTPSPSLVLKQPATASDAQVAFRNAYTGRLVTSTSKKFIDRCRKDGQVELNVITGDVADTEFGKFGSLVFELFYRVDLGTMS